MQETSTLGLRDRKRLETRVRLEHAAVAIVLDEGLEHLTIDGISERADVSPRTFFNYFDSKEDAILGIQIADDTEGLIEDALQRIQPTSLIDGVVQLLVALVDNTVHDPELRSGRRTIVQEHPELLHRQHAQMSRMLGTLTRSVHTLMARVGAESETADPEPGTCTDAQAQVVLMACGAALRATIADTMHQRPDIPTDESIELIQNRAVTLVREAVKQLQ